MTNSHTFLFADIAGYTRITEQEGDQRAADLALKLKRAAIAAVDEFGADLIKAIGDAVMIRTEHPREALAVAWQLRHDFSGPEGYPQLHIGIHTGPAICVEGDWFGHAVNIAARLADSAKPNEILCTEATLIACGDHQREEFRSRGKRRFRNSAPKHLVYEAELQSALPWPAVA